MLMYRLAIMLCLALTFNAALAEDYVMPEEISEFGHVYKRFHMGACGLFTLQHPVKYDASAEQSEDGRQRTLIAIVDASRKMVADVEQAAWQPDCDTNK